jgi:glutathione S-transferase
LITLYVDGYYVNQFDATCMIALEEKAVEYTTARALLRDGGGVPIALAQKTGLPRVPAMQHGDFWLSESIAIVEYLDESFPAPPFPSLLPATARARARARQLMAFVRFELGDLRAERAWWMCVYPTQAPPLSAGAERDAKLLLDLVATLTARGDLGDWNIAHADLALTLYRLARTDYPLPADARRVLDASLARPSVRKYIEHQRPPFPPPRPLAMG